ncbi:hypothetical protein SGFS_098250 [Streptomyces graminofaciens]|uniref:Uncharacterized protein n=1 Tax=Streptomyces graminofaciens TaxID=68212 RepID=A0ABN5VYJ8_9ACTN|nr:hypothetical protein [Streptomyces graminofaciens]BBC38531.1 hypothetical protein SGFS_098250 [Streptomyces graminofaciens]
MPVRELLDGREGVLRQVLHRLDQLVTQHHDLLGAVRQHIGHGQAAQVGAREGEFTVPAGDEFRPLGTEGVDSEAERLCRGGRDHCGAGPGTGVHRQAQTVDLELWNEPAGGGEGELVGVAELLEDLRRIYQVEPGGRRGGLPVR